MNNLIITEAVTLAYPELYTALKSLEVDGDYCKGVEIYYSYSSKMLSMSICWCGDYDECKESAIMRDIDATLSQFGLVSFWSRGYGNDDDLDYTDVFYVNEVLNSGNLSKK